jgi:hypothetical protein
MVFSDKSITWTKPVIKATETKKQAIGSSCGEQLGPQALFSSLPCCTPLSIFRKPKVSFSRNHCRGDQSLLRNGMKLKTGTIPFLFCFWNSYSQILSLPNSVSFYQHVRERDYPWETLDSPRQNCNLYHHLGIHLLN